MTLSTIEEEICCALSDSTISSVNLRIYLIFYSDSVEQDTRQERYSRYAKIAWSALDPDFMRISATHC